MWPPLAAPAGGYCSPAVHRRADLHRRPELDSLLGLFLLVAAALYLYGVLRLRQRGDRWPVGRTVAFLLGGLGSIAAVTVSGMEAYDTTLISVHMVQHMVLSMIAPIFLALGAPVTLALRTLPARPRAVLLAVLHSRVGPGADVPAGRVRALHRQPVRAVLQRPLPGHPGKRAGARAGPRALHRHRLPVLLAAAGPRPAAQPVAVPGAGAADGAVGAVPHGARPDDHAEQHAARRRLVPRAAAWPGPTRSPTSGSPAASCGPAASWSASPCSAVLVLQWIRQSEREARRIDRALDRAEAEARSSRASASPAQQPTVTPAAHHGMIRAGPPDPRAAGTISGQLRA